MPAPTFSLPTSGSGRKQTAKGLLDAEINRVISIVYDQANPEDRVAAAISASESANSAADAAADRAAADASASIADTRSNEASLAAQAAGAPLFASVFAGEAGTADGETFMVQIEPGTAVYERVSGSGVLLGWLGELLFSEVSTLLSSNLTGFAVGQVLRTRKGGYCYEVVSGGEDLTTLGGVKLKVIPLIGSILAAKMFGAKGDFNYTAQTGTDDTMALQRMFARANAEKLNVQLGTGDFLYSDLLATADTGYDVSGLGWNTALVKSDSYTGAAFELEETFGPLGQYFTNKPLGENDTHVANHDAGTGGNVWNNFCIVGQSRSAIGHGIEFKNRNDLIRFNDIKIFNLRGSAIRFTGEKGNLREGTFTRLVVRMCGSEDHPAVDFRQPTFTRTSCTVTGTSVTLTGTGNVFTELVGGPQKMLIQGARSDGGILEVSISEVTSATTATLASPVEIDVSDAPCTFYADVDGQNHIVMDQCQIVGCFGTYLRLSHERQNSARRFHFYGLMLHGQPGKADGAAGDLLLIEGFVGSAFFSGLRLNSIEADPVTLEKFAGVRVRGGPTLTQARPDRLVFDGLDMLNLENNGEGYFVIERVGAMSVQGTVACSVNSGPELVVKSGAVETQLNYAVKSGTSLNARYIGAAEPFDIAADQRAYVHGKLYETDNFPLTARRYRLLNADAPANPATWVANLASEAPGDYFGQDAYQLGMRTVNSIRSPGLFWHANGGEGIAWQGVQTVMTATSSQMADIADNCNTNMPTTGWCIFNTTLGKPLWKKGNTPQAPWVDAMGATVITPS